MLSYILDQHPGTMLPVFLLISMILMGLSLKGFLDGIKSLLALLLSGSFQIWEAIAGRYSTVQGLRGVIACSSSSVITKRFSANRFDRDLVASLMHSEQKLKNACYRIGIPIRILRPSMIYGKVGDLGDQNLSFILKQLRRTLIFPIPAETGLRQPIQASQLAAVVIGLAKQLVESGWQPALKEHISLGGDTTLTYGEMIRALQQAQPSGDPARRCHLLPIPNRLFFLLAAPLLLRSPKTFEAVLRMGANLSGFTPAYQLLESDPQPFPVLPLA